jgi:peptidoglycan/LPS O-acetylase OafA/YrhL
MFNRGGGRLPGLLSLVGRSSAQTNSQGSRLSELDSLRGIAALVVVAFHYTFRYNQIYHHVNPLPFAASFGYHGIDLFFAISGFVILMTLERTRQPSDFLVSRFSRLYPAYWAAMILTTLVVNLGGLRDQQLSLKEFLENLPMIQTLLSVRLVDGAYWTLAIELCFYGCMFLLFLGRSLQRIEPLLVIWIALKWLWATEFFGLHHMSWALGAILIQQYIPFFAIGMICYRLFTGTTSVRWAIAIIAFAVLTELCLDGIEMGVVAVVVAAIFLLVSMGHGGWLRQRPLLWLGTVSYPLYLLHENIGRTVIHLIESRGFGEVVAVPIAVVIALLLAHAVNRLVEVPALEWIRSRYRRFSDSQKAAGAQPVLQPSGTTP